MRLDRFRGRWQKVSARAPRDNRDERAVEQTTLADKIAKAQASIDRYLRAFEEGTMPEKQGACASVS